MKTAKIAIGWMLCQMALLVPLSGAQQPADPHSAPIPAQIVSGKRVFISNASGESAVPAGTPELTYNEFYAAIQSWKRYDLVSTPADADLVFEIRFVTQLGTTHVMNGTGGSGEDYFFKLVILDPKTHVVLWAFTRGVPQSGRQATGRKYFDQAMVAIVDDLKKLAAGPSSPEATAPNKCLAKNGDAARALAKRSDNL